MDLRIFQFHRPLSGAGLARRAATPQAGVMSRLLQRVEGALVGERSPESTPQRFNEKSRWRTPP